MKIPDLLNTDMNEDEIVAVLKETAKKLDQSQGKSILDFSSVRRIDSTALRALEEFADQAEKSSVKTVIRGPNIDVYKVLKLMKLTQRFSFIN
ncbi:MAG: STAS domain-containing protein [Candidatus Sulfotelmatobacter sp.]